MLILIRFRLCGKFEIQKNEIKKKQGAKMNAC
jgi:hypothetical protein